MSGARNRHVGTVNPSPRPAGRGRSAPGRSARRLGRKGSVYILVLGACLVLVTIGLSAVAVGRVNTHNAAQANDWLDAQLLAFSAAEHALAKINASTDWRTTYNNVTVQRAAGRGSFSWRVADELDGDLTDGETDPAVLYVSSSVGGASYSLAVNVEVGSGSGSASTALWGVDGSDGTLFSIGNYNRITLTATSYGRLKWNDRGVLRDVGSSIRAMAIAADGDAYVVCNANLGAYHKPVLLKFNVLNATASGNNVATVLGEINWSKDITGLAIDPQSGQLYALGIDGGTGVADRLLVLSKDDASTVQNVGAMSGGGQKVGEGTDMVFDDQGNLYVSDDQNERLYRVSKSTAAILAIVDEEMVSFGRIEALAWDARGQKLLGSYTTLSLLYWITLRDGDNILLGTFWLTGVENVQAMGFLPARDGGAGELTVHPAQTAPAVRRIVQ